MKKDGHIMQNRKSIRGNLEKYSSSILLLSFYKALKLIFFLFFLSFFLNSAVIYYTRDSKIKPQHIKIFIFE